MKKYIVGYITCGIGLVFLTGILGLILGLTVLSDEISRYIIEGISSFLGSMYLVFLLWRIRQKDWDNKRSRKEKIISCVMGLFLFGERVLSRLTFIGLNFWGKTDAGYVVGSLLDICALVGIWFWITDVRKELSGNE